MSDYLRHVDRAEVEMIVSTQEKIHPSQHRDLIDELTVRAYKLLEGVKPCPNHSRRWEYRDVLIGETSSSISICIGLRPREAYTWREEDATDGPRYRVSYRIGRVLAVLRILREHMVLDDIAGS